MFTLDWLRVRQTFSWKIYWWSLFLVSDPNSFSSLNLRICLCQASMISLPLRLPISRLCLHDGSNHASLAACLFGKYLEPHGLWVHFIVFGRHSVITYWVIIVTFNGGYFPVTFMSFRQIQLKLIALLSKLLSLLVFWLERCCLSDAPLIFSS